MTTESLGPGQAPDHVEGAIQAIAKLTSDHQSDASRFQRHVDEFISFVGRPKRVLALVGLVIAWIGLNLAAPSLGLVALDPPPFVWLESTATIAALFLGVMILVTQRQRDKLEDLRDHVLLELAILGEQKTAKIIELLEALRADHPAIPVREDAEAEALSRSLDPQSAIHAIKRGVPSADPNDPAG